MAVQPSSAPRQTGFDQASKDAGKTIYPGLIELHNHLSYNALLLWDVQKNTRTEISVKLAQRPPLSQELLPEVLDRLTVADDQTFLDRLREELRLPG